MPFLGFLVRFLGDGILSRVVGYLEKKQDADTARDGNARDVAVEALKAEIAARQAAAEIVKAEQGWWVTAMIRPAFAYPLALWWAAVIFDSIFHFGWKIAALPAPLSEWAGWIVLSFFVTRPFEKAVRSWRS